MFSFALVFFSFLFLSSYFISLELFGLKFFSLFFFCLKTLFSSHTFSTVYYFSSFLDKDIYLWRVTQVWSLYGGLFEFFAFSGFFEFCFFPYRFIFVNSSRAHIGSGNGGFLFFFFPFCFLSLPCFALFICLSPCSFFFFYSNHEGNEVTMSTPLRSYEVTKLHDVMSKAISFMSISFHSCLLT